MHGLKTSLDELQARIAAAARRAGRDPASVALVAVSKGQDVERILAAARLGHRDFGENYVQEWLRKKSALEASEPALAAELRWHFIGHLQRNKAEAVVGVAALLQSLDSLPLAQKISGLAQRRSLKQPVLIEVKLGDEAAKTGMSPEQLRRSLADLAALPGLDIRGLMAIPPPLDPPERARPYFLELKSLLDECNRTGFFERPWTELSMGMSHDFEIAVEAGATQVRIGTALFGPRTG